MSQAGARADDRLFYVGVLRSNECACGNEKHPTIIRGRPVNVAFCGQCYQRLPRFMQRKLWYRLGQGFEEAYEEAHAFLQAHIW